MRMNFGVPACAQMSAARGAGGRIERRRYGVRLNAAAICRSIAPVEAQSDWLSLRGSGDPSSPGYVASTDPRTCTSLASPYGDDDTGTVNVDTRFVSASEFSANLHVM